MPTPEQKPPMSPCTLNEWIATTGRPEARKDSERPESPEPQSECLTADTQADFKAFHFPCRTDALLIGICTAGQAALSCNLREYRLRKNMLFCCTPETIVQVRPSQEFRSHVVVISPAFLHQLPADLKPEQLRRADDPRAKLDETESGLLCDLVRLLEQEVRASEQPCSRAVVRNLLAALLAKTEHLLQTAPTPKSHAKRTSRSRSEGTFRRFLTLLDAHYRHMRNVGFYAQQLGLSPKYLTTLFKQMTGSSVSAWIGRRVVLEAQVLLKQSDKSIQEIAACLHFPNQSFFGTYFKRVTGLSPTQYKNSNLSDK